MSTAIVASNYESIMVDYLKDVEKWWKIAPPNDERKKARLEDYFSERDKSDRESQDETPI